MSDKNTLGPTNHLPQSNAANVGRVRQYSDTCGKCGARRVDSQFGLESTVEEYVDKLVALFRELRRALRDDGVLFLNLGDSYNGSGGAGGDYAAGGLKDGQPKYPGRNVSRLKPKDLIGIPWRVAFALQADGWYLRSEIIWHKRAPMPESVTDRPTKAHEQVFLLTKSPRYWYDSEAIREPATYLEDTPRIQFSSRRAYANGKRPSGNENGKEYLRPVFRNKRSVWTLGPESYKGAHFAVMPTKLVEPCILAGCPHKVCAECGAPHVRQVEKSPGMPRDRSLSEGWHKSNGHGRNQLSGKTHAEWKVAHPDIVLGFAPTCDCNGDTRPGVVLDPFLGSGTVAAVARRLGRDWLGFELNADYTELAWNRIGGTQPALFEVT